MLLSLNKNQYINLQINGIFFVTRKRGQRGKDRYFHLKKELFRDLHDVICLIRRHPMEGNFPINNSFWLSYRNKSVSLYDVIQRDHHFTFEPDSWINYISSVHKEIYHLSINHDGS